MSTQPEALRLAEVAPYLEGGERGQWIVAAATELRRLHSLNQELLEALRVAKAGEKLCEKVLKARKAINKTEGEQNEL